MKQNDYGKEAFNLRLTICRMVIKLPLLAGLILPLPGNVFPIQQHLQTAAVQMLGKKAARASESLGKQLAYQCLVGGIVRFGIRALFPPEHAIGQRPRHRAAQQRFFHPVFVLYAPRDVEHVFQNAVIGEGDAHLHRRVHAHMILAGKQIGHKVARR